MKKALVITGGGSKGAWGGGVCEYLIKEKKEKYDVFSGTSTGALLITGVALNKINELKELYINISNDEIYDKPPFKIIENNEKYEVKLNFFNVLYNFFKNKLTFGTTEKLKNKIYNFFSKEEFELLKYKNIHLYVTVTNLTLGQTEYKLNLNENYDNFINWIWASTCAAPFMSIYKYNNYYYMDGGLIENIPLNFKAINEVTEIDVISLCSPYLEKENINNIFSLIQRIFDILLWENSEIDFKYFNEYLKNKEIILNIYKLNKRLTNNPYIFNKKQMEQWWIDGYNYAKNIFENNETALKYLITKNKIKRL